MQQDLNDIAVFTKVVEARSFTAAGKLLGLPNSSVSRKVTRLEEHLGVRLLHRTTRKVSLTEGGRLYYERSVQLLAGLEEAESLLADTRAMPRGRVGVVAPPEHVVSMNLINDFLTLYPDVRVDVRMTSENINIIHAGYDVAIVPGPVTNLSLTVKKLLDSPFQLVAAPAYLKRRGVPTSVKDLSDHDCVIFGPVSASHSWELRDGSGWSKVPVHGRVAANHLEAVLASVVAGHGIALLPELQCVGEIKRGSIVQVLPGAEPPAVPLHVAYESGKLLSPAVRVLVDFIVEHFPQAFR